jgi:V/A-type H+-transporting ATPase subunit I
MSLRTVPARWFEVLTLPELIPQVVETLARSGSVELETPGVGAPAMALPDLQERMADYRQLAERYGDYWPAPEFSVEAETTSVVASLDGALQRLEAWAADAEPEVRALEAQMRDREDLELLQRFLSALGTDARLDLGRAARSGPALASTLLVLGAQAEIPADARRVLMQQVRTEHYLFLLLLGPPDTVGALREELSGRQARPVPIPDWLSGTPGAAMAAITDRLAAIGDDIERHRQRLEQLGRDHDVAHALGDIRRLEWLVGHMPRVPVSEHFAWISGWTDDWAGETLPGALGDLPALIHFPPPPPDREAPLLLRNPVWVRPFELFARLIGMPGRNEADPSLAVALVAPLMFGYMFGDAGQGLVLAAVGWALRHRLPALRLLIPGGLAAAVFGLLFGSLFSLEHVIPALWVHPMAEPLPVLAVPVAFGAGLLLVSMLLEAVQQAWLGRLLRWLSVDAGLLALYLGLIGSLWRPGSAWLAAAGAAWFLAGAAWQRRSQPFLAAAAALGELAERGLQLLVNTLSFARVGAFTLAHAGLSQAVTSLAAAAGWGLAGGIVLVLGNVVIIALEGLVVSVQTTRLVLFEFFVRFLHGGGRAFSPISPPAARALVDAQGDKHAATAR